MSRLLASALIVALLQIGFLSWVIVGRAAILRNGAEVLLRVEPIDPRDLLRGDYVRLGYAISNLPLGLIADRPPDMTISEAGPITVRLAPGAEGTWSAVSAFLDNPPEPPGAGQVDIAGRVEAGWSMSPDGMLRAEYGIERFYVPEGKGLAIERVTRERPFTVVVAVADDGTAQVKALMDGAKRVFEEPLY